MKKKLTNKYWRIALIGLITVIVAAIIALLAIYLWPLRSAYLQTGQSGSNFSFEQAKAEYQKVVASEKDKPIIDDCNSLFYSHGKKAAKSVVMYHGVTACPRQFKGLAEVFYGAGYNVYIPRAPHHGLTNKNEHGKVRSKELIDYVNQSLNIADGMGDEVGVVGLSGGGMLATWAAEYRPEVSRALVLSPFYEPAPAQAPKWQLPMLNVLYGMHILPDTFTVPGSPDGAAFSYRALGNYNIITKNLKDDPKNASLKSFATIISADDDQIDLNLAASIPEKIAKSNKEMKFIKQTLPADWKLGHDIVSLDNKYVASRYQELFDRYLRTYEGQEVPLQ